ncbi:MULTISPECIES: hypothetical protein [Streptomyces]|uniref:hypothetical protein n=1 Tax=Streptomyces TaxID=1883 RepID=UPI0016763EFF|nr:MULTISPECIES: hypothetical protein [Streptomyces]MBK3523878.1 hypothetical protein [Streptomyces sp. MBT70]GGS10265.1 hypothetical protein GCM10010236_75950 [Streptomyces eurythermus]
MRTLARTGLLSFALLGVAAAPPVSDTPPFVVVTRTDGTTRWVGGTTGCFGIDGMITKVNVTPGYKATLFSDYGCQGIKLGEATRPVDFHPALVTHSLLITHL